MTRMVLLLSVALLLGMQAPPTYTNPIITPVAADPDVIRAQDGNFYLYATQDDWGNNQGVHIVPIFRSRDLVNWEFVKDVFTLPPAWKEGGGFVWAPDISYWSGTYHLYYSASVWNDPNPCIGLATAKTPTGPFEDLGRPLFCSEDIGVSNSIDPFVFNDPRQRTLFWGSFNGIYAIDLSADGSKTVGSKVEIADSRFEASFVYKKDRYYYLFVSLGSCCNGADSSYSLYMGRALNLLGPYLDSSGLNMRFGGGDLLLSRNEQWIGPGHNSVIRDDQDNDWLVYHAIPADNPRLASSATRRPALMERINWKDGWPVIEGPSSSPQAVPTIKPR